MMNFDNYTINQYLIDVEIYGINVVWEEILNLIETETDVYGVLKIESFGELYEIGLAHINKIDKRNHGKYYTPDDVAKLMSEWFLDLEGTNICDVCCGTGNLILSYFKLIGKKNTRNIISSGKLFLYDQDELALKICKSIIGITYGKDISESIHFIAGDFLDRDIQLPSNCKVISNPPYFRIKEIKSSWENTNVIKQSKEFYSAIMEKVINGSKSSVIITPYSFIGGEKFYPLRKIMNKKNGYIVSFDNIPGNIFIGRKHGIFNSNSTNSVRAAITVVENKGEKKGFRCSNLIRFKNEERESLLKTNVLDKFIGKKYQIVSEENKKYIKCQPKLEEVLEIWNDTSKGQVLSDLTSDYGKYTICIPNTCRYFSVGSKINLNRNGKNYFSFDDESKFSYVYCLINSSFGYWHWRLYDGGITYSNSLLKQIPVFYDKLTPEDKIIINDIAKKMQSKESKYLSYKKNAGVFQENIKFPDKYRNEINKILLSVLNIDEPTTLFDDVHSNTVFSKEVLK